LEKNVRRETMGWVLRKQVGFVLCVSAVLALFGSSGVWGYEEEIKQLSAAIANDISGVGTQTIAVVDFTDLQGNVTEFGRFVAEEMSVDLAMSGKGFRRDVSGFGHVREGLPAN
jgi:hypothetical protein